MEKLHWAGWRTYRRVHLPGRTCRLLQQSQELTPNKMCVATEKVGAPGRARTCDLLIRSQTLYPTELRVPA